MGVEAHGPLRHAQSELAIFDALAGIPWPGGDEQPLSVLRWGDSMAAVPLLALPGAAERVPLRPHGMHDARVFQRVREQGNVAAAAARALDAQRVELRLWVFRERTWDVPIDVAVDDRDADVIRRLDADVRSVASAVDWLAAETLVHAGDETFTLVSGIPLDAQIAGRFRVHGTTRTLFVSAAAEGCTIERITPRARRDATLTLAAGAFRFVERGSARGLADEYQRQIRAINETPYLRAWEHYEALWIADELATARSVGAIPFADAVQQSDQRWRVRLERPTDEALLDPALRYHAVANVPQVLQGSGEDAAALKALTDEALNSGTPALKLFDVDTPYVDLEIAGTPAPGQGIVEPPRAGFLILSVTGTRTQSDRRRHAREQLAQHHGLSLALAGRRPPSPARAARKLPTPLPLEVEAVFTHGSTAKQREALAAVYENQGLTLIQGPPGTGKSTVIAALHKLLVHLHGDAARRGIVISAPQHEAVATVSSKIDVLGLPVIRLGRTGDGLLEVERWAAAQAERLGEQLRQRSHGHAELPDHVAALQRLASRYRASPMPLRETARMLAELAGEGAAAPDASAPVLSADLRGRLRMHADALAARTSLDEGRTSARRRTLRRCAALLRLTPAAFADDGRLAAARAQAGLRAIDALDPEADEALTRAAAGHADDAALLAELGALRARLLDVLVAGSDLDRRSVRDVPATALAGEVIDETTAWLEAHSDPVDRVLRRLRDQALHDPEALQRAIENYSVALAATVQGVGSAAFNQLTGENPVRTAIVDEAARGNPLDVLIPLVRALDRQVLVGDHRQLPHMLEPKLADDLEGQLGPELRKALQESLFERLFNTLRGSARCVTLDQQFRMHPDLGEFVSTAFYPLDERFGSRLPPEHFHHGLGGEYEGRVAVWLDEATEPERKVSGQTYTRAGEARRIADEAGRILEERPDLSVGIVSMYGGQVRKIEEALADAGILRRGEDGYEVAERYRWVLRDGRPLEKDGSNVERLAFGTVDSFQGREFDVVFVSLVRCNNAATSRARLGFVAMRNRLNVAMSRQRRLLVVCGCRRTFLEGPAATWDDTEPLRLFDALTRQAKA